MKKHLIFILILTMVMLYTGCSKDNTPEDPSGSQSVAEDNIIDSKGNDIGKESGVFEGDKAKDFYIEDNSGRGIRLDDLAGKVTLLNFWTSWSLHSESMNNLISEFHEIFGDNINIVSVNVTAGERPNLEYVLKYIETNDYQFPIYFDLDGNVAKTYLVRSFPTTYIIDSKGYVSRIYVGEAEKEDYLQYINALIEAEKR